MKSLFTTFLTAFCLLLGTVGVHAEMGEQDKLSKDTRKECKKAVKQLKEEGWTASGKSLECAMEDHFLVLEQNETGAFVIEGNGRAFSPHIAIKRAMTNASSQYATMQESSVEGHVDLNVSNESSGEVTTHTTLNSSYVSSTTQKVRSFIPTVTLYRKTEDGKYEARVLYVIDGAGNPK